MAYEILPPTARPYILVYRSGVYRKTDGCEHESHLYVEVEQPNQAPRKRALWAYDVADAKEQATVSRAQKPYAGLSEDVARIIDIRPPLDDDEHQMVHLAGRTVY